MRDPKLLSAIIALTFLFLSFIRFEVLNFLLFDEFFYIPAAKALLTGEAVLNREHPMLGKEMMALSIAVFGDNPVGWRLPSMVMMPSALFLAARSMWHFTNDSPAATIFGLLLATSCLTLVLARIGTLDAPMLFFAALGSYALSRSRRNLAAMAFGLSLASKWTLAPLLPVLAAILVWKDGLSWQSLIREFSRFGLLPVATYLLTFAPAFFVRDHALKLDEIIPLQIAMQNVLLSFETTSPYPARWWEMPFNLAPFWVFADFFGSSWRFVILVVNPVSALFLVAAVLMCWRDRRAFVLLPFYLLPLILAAASSRPSFIHQYAFSMTIGMAMVALMAAPLKARWIAAGALPVIGTFAFFYPYLTAAPFSNVAYGQRAVWLDSWQFVDMNAWNVGRDEQSARDQATREKCLETPKTCDFKKLKATTSSSTVARTE